MLRNSTSVSCSCYINAAWARTPFSVTVLKSNHPLRKIWNYSASHSPCLIHCHSCCWVFCVEFWRSSSVSLLWESSLWRVVPGRQKSILIRDKVIQFQMYHCLEGQEIFCKLQLCKCLKLLSLAFLSCAK